MSGRKGNDSKLSSYFTVLPQSRLRLDSSPASGGAFWCSANSYVKPALKGEVDMSVSECTEGLHRGFACLRQPLSQSALRRIASSPAGEPFGCDTICQDIRVNAQVGTRSPYSLPFVILPVPARSPFRFIRHWRRSTPNLTQNSKNVHLFAPRDLWLWGENCCIMLASARRYASALKKGYTHEKIA